MTASVPARSDEDPLERPPGGNPRLVDGPSERLRLAAKKIGERWAELDAGWMASAEEASVALELIVRRVEGSRSGGDALQGQGGCPPIRPLLHHRLCEVLRQEMLEAWASGGSGFGDDTEAREFLDLIAALERYRLDLWPGGREDAAARLAEPDAFELVVELAHDLRSPLSSVLFLSEVLRSGQSGPVTHHQRSQLGLIYSAALGMVSVVSDVMDLATEQKGVGDEEPAPFSLGQVFDSVREMVLPMAEEKGIGLDFRLPDYDRCVGHPGPLGRVLLNLTTNALKFTEEGTVTVAARKVDRTRIRFSVRDTGRGISDEELARLFHPFRKASQRQGYFFSGSGLGLSIARRLVAAMDSELEIETHPGQGTCFSFDVKLPAASSL